MQAEKHKVDCLIVGAGYSGLVMAEQLSNRLGWKCAVVDKRNHIGGNSYDYKDEKGVLIHKYGPHYFRTNSERIVEYLSQYTEWHSVEYTIKSYTDGKYWNFPINLNTFEQLIGREATSEEFEQWLEENKEDIEHPANSEEVITSQVGRDLYEKFFKGYTIKQWKKHPRELDSSVCGRIPIRTNRDDRYLREKFQALPKEGYTALFERLVESIPSLQLELNCDFEQAKEMFEYKLLVYTGPIDAYFGYSLGKLPYRSLKFEYENFTTEELGREFWQPAMQVNYPSADVPYTRIVEIKHATGQKIDATTIVREFPADFEETGDPYYPVPMEESKELYKAYAKLAEDEEHVVFTGRLGTYMYYNMDQVVAMALKEADKIISLYSK